MSKPLEPARPPAEPPALAPPAAPPATPPAAPPAAPPASPPPPPPLPPAEPPAVPPALPPAAPPPVPASWVHTPAPQMPLWQLTGTVHGEPASSNVMSSYTARKLVDAEGDHVCATSAPVPAVATHWCSMFVAPNAMAKPG